MACFLPEAVESVVDAGQPAIDIELVIIDDGSTDHTPHLVAQLQDQYRRVPVISKFIYIENGHGGKSQALNTGLAAACGRYIAILDADDKLLPGSLLHRFKSAVKHNADLVIGSFSTFGKSQVINTRNISPGTSAETLMNKLIFAVRSPFHQNSMLFARHLVQQAGPFDERLLRAQDKDYALRLLEKARKMVILEESVYMYRRYPRGFYNRIRNRVRTMRYKSMVLSRHTRGLKQLAALVWGNLVELTKLGYELFSFYRR